MAQKRTQRAQIDEEDVYCEICFDLLKYPVTIPCGHNFCINCIKAHWDEEEETGTNSCPQCWKTFNPSGASEKTTALPSLVEQLKKISLQAAPDDSCYAGLQDVACFFCCGRKLKAISFCFICQAFYCSRHVHPHFDDPPLKKHKMVKASKMVQNNICSRHDEVIDVFCRTDQKFICSLCLEKVHQGHDTVSAAAERAERQRELEERRGNIQQRIQDREKDVKLLQQEVEAINHSADKTVEDSEKIFTELIRLLQKRSSDVKQQIRSQQETEVSRVKDVQEKLEQEITELKRKDAELEQLSHTEDHNQFLLNYPSLPALSESTHSSSINIRPLRHFEDVTAAVSELREKLQDVLRDSWTNISLKITKVDVFQSEPEPEPTTRAEFLRYSREITLDPNTAHSDLVLSEGNRKVTKTYRSQSYPSHPDRFTECKQVLSKESLTGRCYWEVEWTDKYATIAVAYKNIRRVGSGHQCIFGNNDRSWALDCSQGRYTGYTYDFRHNNKETSISGPGSSTIGVYLDHRAGVLSFYSISETMTLLHRVQTTFTKPLLAGIRMHMYDDTAEFCQLT
ncbi:tripartite motif-containing protein 16-like [Poecilia formosa]|uniref:tripartite motif-containing protein 16-like n=1 Tax=Poecilia formosa TaxID=48698 RepID=UPI0004441BB6|nr:PREDICTED: tripartite motif-containing protein 16-like [Poecilia formosa]